MADRRVAAKDERAIALIVSYFPSVNKTPIGSGMPPVPYDLQCDLQNFENVAPDVQVLGSNLLHEDSFAPMCSGDSAGSGGGVQTESVGSLCRAIDYCPNVRVSGKRRVTYDGAWAWMNCAGNNGNGNTKGKIQYLFVKETGPVDPMKTHLEFNREKRELMLVREDGTTETFTAHNKTVRTKPMKGIWDGPDQESLTPDSNRPIPDGLFPLQDWEATAEGDDKNAIGPEGKVPLVLPPGRQGWRGVQAPGRVLIHSFGDGRTVDTRTNGCIRTSPEAMRAIRTAKPEYIIVN